MEIFKKVITATMIASLFAVSFLTAGTTPAVTKLTELTKPDSIISKNGKLYILERTFIYIYSQDTLKLEKKFGRSGEGPGESSPHRQTIPPKCGIYPVIFWLIIILIRELFIPPYFPRMVTGSLLPQRIKPQYFNIRRKALSNG